ncbi:RagB/SusD family nutrient uptake outer membrane protein [Mucilaginibacter mali]|uniref:RagB/SusD family nutrient uptake outer membrane protein n=1 Tax=Mucilaginibacter mali TaxID=2740462 RepID=A0A7D4UNF5_9SPHI|nr:RagB/SusD family nutrient uptake outer membrane protein [Mucilaginibacter mali]QKJ28920.1 RagB/SusD family nutrient uptake outer membrane protein [Mucilaginibacter mali]
MKIKRSLYILFAAATMLASCKKEFLDEKPPTAVPVADAIKTESDLTDAVNGMYAAMRSTLFYGRDVPFLGDELADNTYISSNNSGRYLPEMAYTYIAGTAEPANIWAQGYYTILQANRIIYAANTLPNSNNVNQLKGEAYAVRALSYLTLVNFYAKPFTVDPAAIGVPLVTAPTNITGPFVKPVRSTTAQVYAKIISDLDSAYAIMPTTTPTLLHPTNSEYISKYAAKAIEARAYLYKGDYANARDAALLVVNNGGYTLATSATYASYWATPTPLTNKQETIFELGLNTANNNGNTGLDYFYNQAGYGDALAYLDFYNSFSATDVRKSLFLTSSSKRGAVIVVNKYQNVTIAGDKDDVKVIRYSEVLLTLAEAYARTGNEVNALLYLNQLAQRRDPSLVAYASTGATLINDIINERRKELAFEGLRYFDLTRLNLPVNRPAQTSTATTVRTLDITSNKRIFPIPQGEIDANPAMTQNTGY